MTPSHGPPPWNLSLLKISMSTAAVATAPVPDAVPKKNGRKKLFILALAVLLLMGIAAAYFVSRSHTAAADDEDEDATEATQLSAADRHAPGRETFDPKHPPVFLSMESFTFNLADRDADHIAQVSIALEVEDNQAAERVKHLMPVIRSSMLLALSSKYANELRTEEGKRLLAAEMLSTALRPLGHDLAARDLLQRAAGARSGANRHPPLPVKAVHFANFIVQ
jgi:flagellar FliL protein